MPTSEASNTVKWIFHSPFDIITKSKYWVSQQSVLGYLLRRYDNKKAIQNRRYRIL